MDLAARYFRRRRPRAVPPGLYRRVVHPLMLRRARGRQRLVLERSEVYFPYLSTRVRYDDARARAALEPAGIRVSPLEEYFDRLVAAEDPRLVRPHPADAVAVGPQIGAATGKGA
jgi:hypothetical protein